MKSKYKFSELIEEISEQNTELKYGLDDIVGVTIEKGLIPTIANLQQTALNKFYIVKPDTFVYNPRTHGVRLGMGFNKTNYTYITSWNNIAFKVKDDALRILNPEYLWLYFNRSEWDRETNYHAWGSSTIVFSWNTFLNLEIQIPEKSYQDNLVRQYNAIKRRIALKQQINDNLAEQLISQFMIFVEGLDRTAQLNSICSFVSEKATFGDLDNQVYVSTENLLPNKQGINYFGTTELNDRITPFKEGDVLIANIRPYFKKIWQCNQSGACNADVLCFRADDNKYKYILKAILYQDSFYDYVMSGAKGTKMPRGDKDHIMKYLIPNIPEEFIIKFNLFATEIERIQSKSIEEIKILSEMKSYLLTTLSSC